jgi:hypothetical protein
MEYLVMRSEAYREYKEKLLNLSEEERCILKEVEALAGRLFEQHGLEGFEFDYNYDQTYVVKNNYKKKRITLNLIWVLHHPMDEVENGILFGINRAKRESEKNTNYWRYKNKLNNLSPREKKRLEKVSLLAREQMEQYGVQDMKFRYTYSKRFLGQCSPRKISLQLNHALDSSMEEIKNTLLHEVAHAVVGSKHGHRLIWQQKAREMGVTGTENYRK